MGDRSSLWTLYTRFDNDTDLRRGPFGLDTFRRNLVSLNAICREHHAKVVLGTFQYYKPWAEIHRDQTWADAWEHGLARENDIIRALADSDDNIWCADVARSFVPTPEHMVDFCHLTTLGNRLIARAFFDTIEAMRREAER